MPTLSQYSSSIVTLDATIANGQTTSAAVDLAGTTLCGIHLPAAFTGATLGILTAPTIDGNFQPIQRNGADVAIAITPARFVSLTASDYVGVQFVKLVSSSAEAGARTLTLALRAV